MTHREKSDELVLDALGVGKVLDDNGLLPLEVVALVQTVQYNTQNTAEQSRPRQKPNSDGILMESLIRILARTSLCYRKQ